MIDKATSRHFVNDRMGLKAASEAMLPTIRAFRAIAFPKQ